MAAKHVMYYDSLDGQYPHHLQTILLYLKEAYFEKKGKILKISEWKTSHVEVRVTIPQNLLHFTVSRELKISSSVAFQGIPRQDNSWDCGVFALMYAEYICRRASIDFSKDDMPFFRQKVVYEIMQMEILPDTVSLSNVK